MTKTICDCGRSKAADKEFCWFCDPNVPASLKKRARTAGGLATRKTSIPDWFDPTNYERSLRGLKEMSFDLIRLCHEVNKEDCAKFFREMKTVMPNAQQWAGLEAIIETEARVSELEQGNGHKLTEGAGSEDDVIIVEPETED